MRGDTFNDHIATKDHILQADGNVTGAMAGQMDHLEGADPQVLNCVGEIYRKIPIDRFRETVNSQELLPHLFSDSGVRQECSETATSQCQPRFMIRDRLQFQFMDSYFCLR